MYSGTRADDGRAVVEKDGEALDPRLDLLNHSPDGFEWGYLGSGPAQLALAILADHLADDERAVRLHQPFKQSIIARMPRGPDWSLRPSEIDDAIEEIDGG